MNDELIKKTFQNRKCLITGGLGFIGSNLARKLVEWGANVTVIDSLIPEYGGNLYNVNGIEKKLKINISDIRDEFSMKYLVQNQEYLFSLAGQTSHMDSMADPQTDLEINAKAQLFILEACRKFNPTIKIVFASTRQIYGKPDYLPVDEKHPVRPVDINGVNKVAGEWYHSLYTKVYGLKTTALRLTNTIGPRMRIKDARQTFLGVWIRQILEGKEIEVWGGDQLRDYTYVEDAVDAFILAAASDSSNNKVFNLGGNGAISLKDTAEQLIQVAGKGRYSIKEYPPERKKIDIGDFYSDCALIEKELGWKPVTSIRTALRKTIEYFAENFKHYL